MATAEVQDKQAAGDQPPAASVEQEQGGRAVLLAWTLSAFVHVLLFILLFVTPWVIGLGVDDGSLLVASTGLVDAPTPTPPSPLPDMPTDPSAALDAQAATPKNFEIPSDLAASPKSDVSVIGVASSGDIGALGLTTVGSGGGPTFFKAGGGKAKAARKIVYVVDRSGSMLATFDAVRAELIRSIGALRRGQRFHVIFFAGGDPIENPAKALVPAIESQKQAAFEFLATIEAQGSTNPGPAMKRAMDLRPDLIFFLTDGDFDPDLVDKLRAWNRDEKVRISTIAYLSEAGRPLLERIAREHGGEFRFVSEHELP